ncbi:MAG: glycosyltransferase family 4 protein [Candidatus Latescibacteria bacterium]|nr:glycosyltransferase family 4 protein [Candidatus Latescibacterota bacterium]
MRKIKLLVDCHYFDTFFSGVTTYIKGIYNELVKYEDVEIYLVSNKIDILAENFPDNRFKYIELKSRSKLKRLLYEIPMLLKKYGIHYAHFQYLIPPIKRCKYIVNIHDVIFEDYGHLFPLGYRITRSALFRFSAKKADILITISEYSRRQISTHYSINYDSILVTPCGVHDKYYVPENENEKHIKVNKDQYLLYVSRFEPRKNHKTLIEAFFELRLYERFSLILIGKHCIADRELQSTLNGFPEEVKARVKIIENVTEEELIEYYRNSSLFVYPSIAEGFGIPPLEAIMSNTKVICSNATAMSDFSFLNGYQFDPLNKDMLKRLMLKTIDDENYPFSKMQAIICREYNWKVAAKVIFDGIKKDINR